MFISTLAATGVILDHVFVGTSASPGQYPASPLLVSLGVWLGLPVVCMLIALFIQFARRRFTLAAVEPRRNRQDVLLIMNAICCVSGFALWHAMGDHWYHSADILQRIGADEQIIVFRGTLDKTVTLRPSQISAFVTDREVDPWQSQLTVTLESVREGNTWTKSGGRVLVYVDGDLSERLPGDRLEIFGRIFPFSGPTNPGEPDLRSHFRLRSLHARVQTQNASAVKLLASGMHPSRGISWIAGRARESLFRHTDQTTGPLAVALVAGQREFVEPSTRDTLLATGTAHLLSVSGMHLAILVIGVSGVLSMIGWRGVWRLALILAFCGLYVAVTGGRPPVMRAAILVSILVLAGCFRRTHQPLNTLAFAALVLIVLNPESVFSVGVHLSFLAVIVLMLSGRIVTAGTLSAELDLKRDSAFDALIDHADGPLRSSARVAWRFIWQMAWLSGCVTAMSLPLVWSTFHLVSLVSVITNVFVWFGLVVALPAGVLTVVLDWIHPWLGAVPGVFCHGALEYMWWVIDVFGSIPLGHVWLPAPPSIAVALFYAVMLVSLMDRGRRGRLLRSVWFVLWFTGALVISVRPSGVPNGSLEVTFIDVGHGTSVIIRDDSGSTCLYDCGRLGNSHGTSHEIDGALWSIGITHLDAVFLSHADADHYNAFAALAERFTVETLVVPHGLLESDDPLMERVRNTIEKHAIPVCRVSVGDQLEQSSLLIRVLHPPEEGVEGSDNANSMVLRVGTKEPSGADTSLLLPGDLEPPGVEALSSQPRPPAGGVMMAPHHGSLTMDAKEILQWAKPATVVVSGGRRSGRPEVEAMLSATGADVLSTTNGGAIRVLISNDGTIEARSFRDDPW
ncbi:MAG: ComEC/Rec2 family competence protein [Planctomycetota bacterium]